MGTRIAFLGLGRMGRELAAHLVEDGHTVTVWNRTASKAQSLVDISEIQHLARRDGFDFHVTAVPAAQPLPQGLPFDPAYMDTVYRAGLATGQSRHGWASDPAPLLGPAASN